MKILVVDDELELCEIMEAKLSKEGFEVDVSSSVPDAKEKIDQQFYNAIVSDIRMPDGGGVEVLLHVKESYNTMPAFIFMTGFSDIRPEYADLTGPITTLAKPVCYPELVELINKHAPKGE